MYRRIQLCGLFLVGVVFCLISTSTVSAQQPAHFPWGNQSSAAQWGSGSRNVYRVLPSVMQDKHHRTEAPSVLYPVPAKQAYSYGWFGSNPSYHWGRHFGHSMNYTQWSRR